MTRALTHLRPHTGPVHDDRIDLAAAECAARDLLTALGVDLVMSLRGVQKPGARTVTSALHGRLRDDPGTRQEFLALTGGSRG